MADIIPKDVNDVNLNIYYWQPFMTVVSREKYIPSWVTCLPYTQPLILYHYSSSSVFTSAASVGVSAAGVVPPISVFPTALPTNTPAPPTCGAKYPAKVRSEKQDEVHFRGIDSVLALNVNRSLINDMSLRYCLQLLLSLFLVEVVSLTLFSTHRKSKLAARTFIQSQYLKTLAASLRVGFCNEWKEALGWVCM